MNFCGFVNPLSKLPELTIENLVILHINIFSQFLSLITNYCRKILLSIAFVEGIVAEITHL